MTIVKWFVLLNGLIIVLFVLGGFLLPAGFAITRSIDIDAPTHHVFARLEDLAAMEAWSAWKEADASMTWTYGDKTAGVGATATWTSRKSGRGSATITEIIPNKRVVVVLAFPKATPIQSTWDVAETAAGVTVQVTYRGDVGKNLFGRYFILVVPRTVAPKLERSLELLRSAAASVGTVESDPSDHELAADDALPLSPLP